MFFHLLRFEALFQLKQRALPLLGFLFLGLGFLVASKGHSPANVFINAPYQINSLLGLFTLGSVFIIMFFAISGTLRDERFHMDMLTFSSPLEKSQFFWSRFSGVFVFSLIAFTPFIIGMMAGHTLGSGDPERLLPFSIFPYLQAWLIIVVPNIFICTSILFAVSLLSQSQVATYVGAVFIYMFYMICSLFLNSPLMAQSVPASPEAMAIAALADPFGISAFFEQTQFWTPFQKNEQMLTFSGYFMWNRPIWMGASLMSLFVTYRLFSFRKQNAKMKKQDVDSADEVEQVIYRVMEPERSLYAQWKALFSVVKIELNNVVKSIPFVAILMIWGVIIISETYSRIVGGGQYGDSLYPLTSIMIENMVGPLRFLSIILIVFYSGEVVWRERLLGFDGILDATPVSNGVLFFAKLIALLMLPFSLISSGIVIGIVFQISSGFWSIEFVQYLALFYFYGFQFLVFSVLGIGVQSTVRNKYLGMGITGIVILASFLSAHIGIEHPMLRFGYLPSVEYSTMTGYTGHLLRFQHLAVYWLGIAGILAALSFKLWQRGTTNFSRKQLFSSGFGLTKREWLTFGIFACIALFGGARVLYNTHVANEYMTSNDITDYREAYERKFKQYEDLAPLYSESIKTRVHLFPTERSYRIEADNMMINRADSAITRVFITAKIPLESISIENARLIFSDKEFDTYLFEFDEALPPNGVVNVRYAISYHPKGYEVDKGIIENGSYLSHRTFEPFFGYRSGLEIQDNFEREKRGLPRIEKEEYVDEHLLSSQIKFGRANYETIVSTDESEIAIASGELMYKWTEYGRNYFYYKSESKIAPTMGYFSSDYAIQKEMYKGISIEQYYFPDHTYNIDSVAVSAKAALDYCVENFGDYPFNHVRIVEVPSFWPMGGFAHPGVISMVEDRMYVTDLSEANEFNLVAKRTIHEVAHQWWGHELTPKVEEGGSLLVEGFAKYTEAVVMEKLYGKHTTYQLSKTATRQYFSGRSWATEAESPVYKTYGESFLSYGKSYTVMLGLRSLIGEEKVNQVLKTLVERHKDEDEFSATTVELLNEIYKVAPQEHHTLIDDWFTKVITYNVSVDEADYEKLANGKVEVSITVKAQRFEMQESGEEIPIDIEEPIEIGLFNIHPESLLKNDSAVYLAAHRITQNTQVIKVIVDELPKYVSIDPFGTRVDENLYDNTVRIKK